MRTILIGLAAAAVMLGGYWFFQVRPRVARILDPHRAAGPGEISGVNIEGHVSDFDRVVRLRADPRGAASNGRELVLGRRDEPGGFIRLSLLPDGGLARQDVRVTEPSYGEDTSYDAVTWNGAHWVGYTSGSSFHVKDAYIFTIHDAETMRVIDKTVAPEQLGCLAWDGQSYWAATRRHTPDQDIAARLYRFDRDFRLIREYAPPGVGCQGLTFDGERLWFADVFADALIVLDLRSPEPKEIGRYESFDYLSGVAWFGGEIWITEYGDKTLRRLHPLVRAALVYGGQSGARVTVTMHGGSAPTVASPKKGLLDGMWIGSERSAPPGAWFLFADGDRFFVKQARSRRALTGRLEIETRTTPAQVDLVIEGCDCESEGKRARAIFEVHGDLLKVAASAPGAGTRPVIFEPIDGVRVADFARFDAGSAKYRVD